MSDFTPRLPNRPSLAQLRKRAKELLRKLRNGDPAATERLRKCKPNVVDPILADVQLVLAREHGFESWPKLVHHIQGAQLPDLEMHRQITEDLVTAYNSADPAAVTRLNDLFHRALNVEQIRDFVRDELFNLPDSQRRMTNFTLADAQLVVARLYGFKDWDEFVQLSNEPASDLDSAPFVLSSKPPFYRIDWTNNSIELRQPMSSEGMKSDDSNPLAKAVKQRPSFIFMEVPDINTAVSALNGAEVVQGLHETFYGAKEVVAKEPGGHFVIFSQLPKQPQQ